VIVAAVFEARLTQLLALLKTAAIAKRSGVAPSVAASYNALGVHFQSSMLLDFIS
jgi:hypothetical protein